MNYRHAFHAGNFADLVKHAALTLVLEALTRDPEPLVVIDTHAGAGAYDLTGGEAQRSGEADAGIGRLMGAEAPEAFDMLVAAVARANPEGGLKVYPGSPALTCAALRVGDRLIACELQPDAYGQLASLLEPLAPQAEAVKADGFVVAAQRTPKTKTLVVIDPPFEARDDYKRTVRACADVLGRNGKAVLLVWLPLKDLETFDAFLRGLEEIRPPQALICEARLRPLADPMAMNGCALAIINAPAGLDDGLKTVCDWVSGTLGEAGGKGQVWRL